MSHLLGQWYRTEPRQSLLSHLILLMRLQEVSSVCLAVETRESKHTVFPARCYHQRP